MTTYHAEIDANLVPIDRKWTWRGASPSYLNGAPVFLLADDLYLSIHGCKGEHRIIFTQELTGEEAKRRMYPFKKPYDQKDFTFHSSDPLSVVALLSSKKQETWSFTIEHTDEDGILHSTAKNPGGQVVDPEFHVGPGGGY